jgi:hypothetical protein
MSRMIQTTVLLAGLMLATTSFADAPAGTPAGATGLCKDGSYWTNATKKGACHGHKGIQTWYGAADAGTAPAPAAVAAAPMAAAPAAPAAAPKRAAAPTRTGSSYTPPATAAAGGGPGMVWVNSSSKVYHCPADRWYGKTKNGAYMSEADAKAQGNHADHGKACQ